MSNYFNRNVNEGLFNPKTTGTDMRVTQGLSPLGQQYGQGAIEAQRQALAGYQGIANGTAPSLAQLQMAQALQMNNRQAMSMAGNARGGNLAGATQGAMGAMSGANAMTAQNAGLLRAAEQQQAYGNMAALGGQMAGQQFGYDQLNQQSLLGLRGQDLNYNLGSRGLDMQADQNAFNNAFQIGTAATDAAGNMLGSFFSDERVKTRLGTLSPGEAGAAVGEIQPVGYEYRSGLGLPPGERTGVSAQQLAGTRLGGLVQPGPDGLLRVDTGGAASTALAASADQEHRLRAMEQQLGMSDPNQSPYAAQMAQQGYDAEYQGGLLRQREASRLSNAIAVERGQAQVRRGTGGTNPYESQFDRAPVMQRGGFDRGNVNLYAQPQVRNPDGSISTVDSSSYNIGGREMLLPSVTPDGRHLATDDEIVGEYNRTGRYLGSFGSPEAASSYASELHDAYANGAFDRAPPGVPTRRETPSPFGPDQREPMPQRGLIQRRRRVAPLVQVTDQPGAPMQAKPVADDMINYDRRAPIEPYRPGSAQALGTDTMIGRRQPLLDPASQAMLDGQYDYLNEWAPEFTDELGIRRRRLLTPEQRDMFGSPTPVDLQRQMDLLEADDRARAIADERARMTAQPRARMVF